MADLLLEVGLVFAAAAITGALGDRLGQSVIPFYILAGMGLSEFVLGRLGLPYVSNSPVVIVGAELGIVFLLFFLGLEFNLDRLLARRAAISRAGAIDFLVNFSAGLALGWIVFNQILPAVLVAGIVYISSSAVITKSLIDLGWIANDEADPILGTLVFEDLLIAVYLAITTAIVLGGDRLDALAVDIGIALGFILALLILARVGTAWIQVAVATDSHEFLVLRALGVTVSIAGVALSIGVSEAVAAFFVGMAFSTIDLEDRELLERLLEPLRDAFAAIFFVWIGLVTDPLSLGGVVGLIVLAVIVTTPTKLVSGYLGGRVFDLDARRSTRVALGMTTRGEFSLIVATVAISGAEAGTIAPGLAETINAFAVGYVLVMATLGTTLMQYSAPFETFVSSRLGD